MLRCPSVGSGRRVVLSETEHANLFIPVKSRAVLKALRRLARPDKKELEIASYRPPGDAAEELATLR